MSKENKRLARRYPMEIFEGNLDLADEIISADFIDHDPSTPADTPRGPEGVKQVAAAYRAALHDMEFTIEDQVAEDDKVLTRWTVTAVHKGELMGVPATNNAVAFTGLTLLRCAEGKIAEEWSNWDGIGLMRQIGALPSE